MSDVPQAKPMLNTQSRNGWILFSGVMITIAGTLNGIDGLVGLYRTRYFSNSYVLGDLREWSFVFLAFGALQIAAGLAILGRQGWARWFGIAMVTINAFLQLFVIGTYPLYATLIIAYDVAIFYALSVRWQPRVLST